MDYWELTTCWNYFLSLDRDLNETARYIEPESQENTFSFEFYKIIMLGCAEIETAFKQVCKAIDSSKKSGSIDKYKEMILSRYPKIEDCEVVVRRWHSRAIRPFDGWSQGPLFWWSAYQDLKHNRHMKLNVATYKNAAYTLAALYVLILYLYRISDQTCKADDSLCFWSSYNPEPYYVRQSNYLPDFADNEKDEMST